MRPWHAFSSQIRSHPGFLSVLTHSYDVCMHSATVGSKVHGHVVAYIWLSENATVHQTTQQQIQNHKSKFGNMTAKQNYVSNSEYTAFMSAAFK